VLTRLPMPALGSERLAFRAEFTVAVSTSST